MPNGHDKNFVRLCATVGSFRNRYGHWPTRVRLFPGTLDNLRSLFTQEDFNELTSKVKLIPDGAAAFVAEDEDGRSHSYGAEGALRQNGVIPAAAWLGVEPIKRN